MSQNPAADRLRDSLAILRGRAERGWQDDPKWDVNEIDAAINDAREALATAERNAYDKVRARLDPLRNADEHAHLILDELSEDR